MMLSNTIQVESQNNTSGQITTIETTTATMATMAITTTTIAMATAETVIKERTNHFKKDHSTATTTIVTPTIATTVTATTTTTTCDSDKDTIPLGGRLQHFPNAWRNLGISKFIVEWLENGVRIPSNPIFWKEFHQ